MTYTDLLNVVFRALCILTPTVHDLKRLDLDEVHAIAAINGEWDENLAAYLKSAVTF